MCQSTQTETVLVAQSLDRLWRRKELEFRIMNIYQRICKGGIVTAFLLLRCSCCLGDNLDPLSSNHKREVSTGRSLHVDTAVCSL